jgi:hypothetical protein
MNNQHQEPFPFHKRVNGPLRARGMIMKKLAKVWTRFYSLLNERNLNTIHNATFQILWLSSFSTADVKFILDILNKN